MNAQHTHTTQAERDDVSIGAEKDAERTEARKMHQRSLGRGGTGLHVSLVGVSEQKQQGRGCHQQKVEKVDNDGTRTQALRG